MLVVYRYRPIEDEEVSDSVVEDIEDGTIIAESDCDED